MAVSAPVATRVDAWMNPRRVSAREGCAASFMSPDVALLFGGRQFKTGPEPESDREATSTHRARRSPRWPFPTTGRPDPPPTSMLTIHQGRAALPGPCRVQPDAGLVQKAARRSEPWMAGGGWSFA